MEKYEDEKTLRDEDDRDNMFYRARRKVEEAWEKGYEVDMEINMDFWKAEEDE